MPSITKPLIPLSPLPKNELGLTIRDYEGQMSTLCAGCGHDSVTAAIVHAFWELSTPPHMIAKLSGIGCSSKTPTYFVRGAHGFNSAHGRMVPVATGAIALAVGACSAAWYRRPNDDPARTAGVSRTLRAASL